MAAEPLPTIPTTGPYIQLPGSLTNIDAALVAMVGDMSPAGFSVFLTEDAETTGLSLRPATDHPTANYAAAVACAVDDAGYPMVQVQPSIFVRADLAVSLTGTIEVASDGSYLGAVTVALNRHGRFRKVYATAAGADLATVQRKVQDHLQEVRALLASARH